MMVEMGISAGDYEGFIKEYSERIKFHRPLMIKRGCQELINLQDLDEMRDPRDPKFKTHQFIDMRGWVSPKLRK
jgi:hypothetical protein